MPYGWLQRAAGTAPRKPALVAEGRTHTYDELLRATCALAALLREWGVEPGDRVATRMASTPEFAAAFCALDAVGAAMLPLDPALKPNEVSSCCQRANVRLLLAGAVDGPVCRPVPPLDELARMSQAGPLPERPEGEQGRYALMLMSSGTTGRPKIVPRTREQLHAERRAINSRMTLRPGDRLFAGLPLFHTAGLFLTLLGSLEHGCTLYLAPYSPRTAAEIIERERITVMHGAPFEYKALAETRFERPPRFDSMRFATFGTALMPPEVVRVCRERLGLVLTPEYGSTEAGPSVMGLPLYGELEPGWIGWPLGGVSIDILGPDGECLPPGREGQLAICHPGAATGYLDDPEATAATFRDGRVLTGDLGALTPEGGIRLAGRMKDMVSVGGKKVAPAEVEAVLREHPDVSEALVLPGEGDAGQEIVTAYVETTAPLTPGAVRTFCGERLAAFKVPRRLAFVPKLPRSATGKVVRRVPPGCD